MMNIKKTIFLATLSGVLFTSCDKTEPLLHRGDYDQGIIVSNEGAFSGGTGTLNYISDDYTTEEATIYKNVNNESLGTIVQSIGFNDDKAYIVANVANKISVADRFSMEKITEITTDLNNPRYIAFANGKGYITNWGDGADNSDDYVAVLDLSTATVTGKIIVSEGPEHIIANGNTLYISHKGGWGSGNSVTVINTTNNTIVKTISVGEVPDEMAIDNNGFLLVSCEGKSATSWNPTEVLGALTKINTTTNTVSSTINFPTEFHPGKMVYNDGSIYLAADSKVYKMSDDATAIPTSEIVSGAAAYGMSVNNNKLYVSDALDYSKNGLLRIFDLKTNTKLKEFTVGVSPGGIYFN